MNKANLVDEASDFIKVLLESEWETLETTGHFNGSPDDERDGFIHLSHPHQVARTVERHFSGCKRVVLLHVRLLGPELKHERAKSGDSFPHLYRPLTTSDVLRVEQLEISQGT